MKFYHTRSTNRPMFASQLKTIVVGITSAISMTLFLGCGGGGGGGSSTQSGTFSYDVNVVDDPIINSTLSATGCSSYTSLGGGKYRLSGCTAKPSLIVATGGFIDLDGDGILDENESTQDSPLSLNTEQVSGDSFAVTPLTTLVAELNASERATLLSRLDINESVLFGTHISAQNLRRAVNAILAGATESGLNAKAFGAALARQLIQSNGTGIDGLKNALAAIDSNETLKQQFGSIKISGFIADARVNAVKNGTDIMDAMKNEKVAAGNMKISGFIYTGKPSSVQTQSLKTSKLKRSAINGALGSATVKLYIGGSLIATTTATDEGKYAFDINQSLIPKGASIQIIAEKAISGGENIKLVSLIPTDTLIDNVINRKVTAGSFGDLIVSNVTTAKAILAQILDDTVLNDGDALETALKNVESGYARSVVQVAGELTYVIHQSGNGIGTYNTYEYAQSLITSTGETTGIVDDHSNYATEDIILREQLTTQISETPPTAADGIKATKAMFTELRSQALALSDLNGTGTPGFADQKAIAVKEATMNIAETNGGFISAFISASREAYKNQTAFPTGEQINIVSAIRLITDTTGANYWGENGTAFNVTILGVPWYQADPDLQDFVTQSGDLPCWLYITKIAADKFAYTVTLKTRPTPDTVVDNNFTGTFEWKNAGQVFVMDGALPTSNFDESGSLTISTMKIKIDGTVDSSFKFTYNGSIKTYNGVQGSTPNENDLDTTFTLTKGEYSLSGLSGVDTIFEPKILEGSFDIRGKYLLTGKITASNFIDITDNSQAISPSTVHVPQSIVFDGKALDKIDNSYISGLVSVSVKNKAAYLDTSYYDLSFNGNLNVPNRPLTTVVLTLSNNSLGVNATFNYSHGTTLITGNGSLIGETYTLNLTNQAGVNIALSHGATAGSFKGTLSQGANIIGSIDTLGALPRVLYYDGTFETLY